MKLEDHPTVKWYRERSKPIDIQRDAEAGENIAINMWKN